MNPRKGGISLILEEPKFVAEYNDGYFLADPALFVKNHYPLDTTWILMDNKPSLTEFLDAPIIYKYAFNHQIMPLQPRVKNLQISKNEICSFLCKAPNTLIDKDISLELVEGVNTTTVKPSFIRRDGEYLEYNINSTMQGSMMCISK